MAARLIKYIAWDNFADRIGRFTQLDTHHRVKYILPTERQNLSQSVSDGSVEVVLPTTLVNMVRGHGPGLSDMAPEVLWFVSLLHRIDAANSASQLGDTGEGEEVLDDDMSGTRVCCVCNQRPFVDMPVGRCAICSIQLHESCAHRVATTFNGPLHDTLADRIAAGDQGASITSGLRDFITSPHVAQAD
eukprot:7382264-Alexandrium_andersonii.AAC.1